MAIRFDSKGGVVARAQKLIAGTTKNLASRAQLDFASGTFTPAQVIASLQTLVTLREDVDNAKAAAKAKVAAENAQAGALLVFMSAFESFVKATFSNSPDVLADFGISRKARAKPTAETVAGAVVKRDATRAARHTMGSRQRQAVKGDVTGVVVTPIIASPPAATAGGGATQPPSAAPAPAATSASPSAGANGTSAPATSTGAPRTA